MSESLEISKLSYNERAAYLLLADFKFFCRYFFNLVFGAEFEEREHVALIQDALLKVESGEWQYLNINVHPGSFKSTILVLFIAWTLARDPRSAYLYVSYSFKLAEKQTSNILKIVSHPQYKLLFKVTLDPLATSKANFKTSVGGSVIAAGMYGTITGFDAGRPFSDGGFLGGVFIDDSIKPEDAFSATMRDKVKECYYGTLMTRKRSAKTPYVSISQRVHEDDLSSVFLKNADGNDWEHLILPFLKENGEVLDPKIMTKTHFLNYYNNPQTAYDASAQYMQDPIPLGNILFDKEAFKLLPPPLPTIKKIFITGDVAETDNRSNDATAFSAWGIFDIKFNGKPSGQEGLIWLNCIEVWVNPDKLLATFMDFYSEVEADYGKVNEVRIENKSMGVMLNSFLYSQPGVTCIPIKRSNKMSKIDRILQAQTKVSDGLICLPEYGKHNKLVLNHMQKITKSGTNLLDDIADTFADAVNLVFFEKLLTRVDYYSEFKKVYNSSEAFRKPHYVLGSRRAKER